MRGNSRKTPVIWSGHLYTDDEAMTGLRLDSPEWFAWLACGKSFSCNGATIRCELRRSRPYWWAYRKVNGKLSKRYLGAADQLTRERLEAAAAELAGPV